MKNSSNSNARSTSRANKKRDEAIEAIHGSVATVADTGHPGEPQPNWGWQAWHRYWVEERVRFYEGIGLSQETLGFHHQTPDELAHYARACTDILYKSVQQAR